MACPAQESTDVNDLKQNFNAILEKLHSLGLSIHILKDGSVMLPCKAPKVQILDGEEALEYFNRPEYSNKVLAFGSRHFCCHSEYLRLRSDYFEALFNGVYVETSMDIINIELPFASADIELLLRYLYSGKASNELFCGVEIFKTIENANFLGVHKLVSLAVEAFAVRWKSLVSSPFFKRSIVNMDFVRELLKYGSMKGLFQDGDKLKIVVNWSAKVDSDISEAQSLILENNCLDTATLADLEWTMQANTKLFTGLDFSKFRGVFARARREYEATKIMNKLSEERSKSLVECVRMLTKQLEEVRCTKCHKYIPRVATKTRTCVTFEHPGEYVVSCGWSCCRQLKKKSRGCKPLHVERHNILDRSYCNGV